MNTLTDDWSDCCNHNRTQFNTHNNIYFISVSDICLVFFYENVFGRGFA